MTSRRRWKVALAATATTVAAVAATVAPASAAGVNYVALGDSYSSGVGSGDYIASSGSCDRSPDAYPALWAAAHSPASYASVACSGATTADVESDQLSALRPSTTLVSITAGGDDVGFTSIIEKCVLEGTDACVSAVHAGEAEAAAELPGRLATLYDDISTDAPSAQVVVLDYPDFYDLSASYCIGLSSTSRTTINQGIDDLDGIIRNAAEGHGFTFADARPAFAHNEICSGDDWLHSVDFSDVSESYHPTASGQSGGYLPTFAAAVG